MCLIFFSFNSYDHSNPSALYWHYSKLSIIKTFLVGASSFSYSRDTFTLDRKTYLPEISAQSCIRSA